MRPRKIRAWGNSRPETRHQIPEASQEKVVSGERSDRSVVQLPVSDRQRAIRLRKELREGYGRVGHVDAEFLRDVGSAKQLIPMPCLCPSETDPVRDDDRNDL